MVLGVGKGVLFREVSSFQGCPYRGVPLYHCIVMFYDVMHTQMYVCITWPQVVGMEARLEELEASQKELTDHKYRSGAAIRELKAKLKTTEEVGCVCVIIMCVEPLIVKVILLTNRENLCEFAH